MNKLEYIDKEITKYYSDPDIPFMVDSSSDINDNPVLYSIIKKYVTPVGSDYLKLINIYICEGLDCKSCPINTSRRGQSCNARFVEYLNER
jgi:hypothetical protein